MENSSDLVIDSERTQTRATFAVSCLGGCPLSRTCQREGNLLIFYLLHFWPFYLFYFSLKLTLSITRSLHFYQGCAL